jgi:hypothetical protein
MSARFRVEQVVVACGLSMVGLSVGALRLLKDPKSRLSRWVDRNVLPYGVTRLSPRWLSWRS